jgi:hypothetical protein
MIEGTPLKPALHRIAALLKMQQNLIDALAFVVVLAGPLVGLGVSRHVQSHRSTFARRSHRGRDRCSTR